eukprot:tig00000492_g1546.t1
MNPWDRPLSEREKARLYDEYMKTELPRKRAELGAAVSKANKAWIGAMKALAGAGFHEDRANLLKLMGETVENEELIASQMLDKVMALVRRSEGGKAWFPWAVLDVLGDALEDAIAKARELGASLRYTRSTVAQR